jgi:hypothetical protein
MEVNSARYKWDGILGIFSLCLGLVYLLLIPGQISPMLDGGLNNVSGRTLPFLLGLLFCILSSLLALRSWARFCALRRQGLLRSHANRLFSGKIVAYGAVIALYIECMEYIGFVVSSMALLAFAMWLTGARNKLVVALSVVAAPAFIYLLFYHVMQIPFPVGLFV